MRTLEELYEEVITEGKVIDWIKDHASAVKDAIQQWTDKHGGVGRTLASAAGAAMIPTSAAIMAAYFHRFFQQHPETLQAPDKILRFVAQFIADNPEVLDLLKKI